MKKKKKRVKTRTLGDLEIELRARDAQLQQDADNAALEVLSKKRVSGINRKNKANLQLILNKGVYTCSRCNKEKKLDCFYTYFDSEGKLFKVFPHCKECDSAKNKSSRAYASRTTRLACFEHYSQNNVQCSICERQTFKKLTLFDVRYSDMRAILSYGRYGWLLNNNFPDIELRLYCYACAFKIINSYIEYKSQTGHDRKDK